MLHVRPDPLRAAAGHSKCPFVGGFVARATSGTTNQQWWPEALNLRVLRQNVSDSAPASAKFDYGSEFLTLDLNTVCADIEKVLTTSQDWWPADYGHYGPFIIRMAWHAAGTYRTSDGRGGVSAGAQRFAPLNSWPDNGNLDKARRLLWPVKQKYGRKLSWADLLVLAGNCALESMGCKTFGFAGGRPDAWEAEEDVDWGSETEWLANKRYTGERKLDPPLAAVQMGLIYVNPQGPDGKPDPLLSAHDIRDTFARMGMNDEETVALIAGGHTFGKAHGAADPDKHVGPEPEGAPLEAQGFGWANSFGSGKGADAITSGLEGAWTTTPTQWDNDYFDVLLGNEWEQVKSPGGAVQFVPRGGVNKAAKEGTDGMTPDAHDPNKRNPVVMFTTDIALKVDPVYGPISARFHAKPREFQEAFARAWYKLMHRDMGPATRCLGPLVPKEALIWQDPLPRAEQPQLVSPEDVAELKKLVLASGVSPGKLVSTAWASASTFRGTDKRGGANGARIRLAPQKDWAANNPPQLATVLESLEKIRAEFNGKGKAQLSLADLIVLAGCAGVEEAARLAGHSAVEVPFLPGRTDATEEQTDVVSFAVLEPTFDGFRNYLAEGHARRAEELLVEKARLLTLTAPEMTVLLGGLRVIGINSDESKHGVFTDKPGTLTNEFFTNLLDMGTEWKKEADGFFHGHARGTGEIRWTGTGVDLVFGSNSQLRAVAEHYACNDAAEIFVADFIKAWNKVMNLDRFDLRIPK